MLRSVESVGKKSMIFITHELPLLYNVTDDIMVMYAGQIVEKGTAKEMVFDPLHPYSKGLMGSIIVPPATCPFSPASPPRRSSISAATTTTDMTSIRRRAAVSQTAVLMHSQPAAV